MSDDLETGRQTPPEPHEWGGIWKSLENANKSWVIAGPFYAAVKNWKAWITIGGIVLFIKGDEIVVALLAWLGAR